LAHTKEELDKLEPRAERFFQTAQDYYDDGKLEPAENLAREAILTNPNQ
jgi:hypothetical protein